MAVPSNSSTFRQVSHMASFNTAAFPDSLALGKADSLLIGTIDEIQVGDWLMLDCLVGISWLVGTIGEIQVGKWLSRCCQTSQPINHSWRSLSATCAAGCRPCWPASKQLHTCL